MNIYGYYLKVFEGYFLNLDAIRFCNVLFNSYQKTDVA